MVVEIDHQKIRKKINTAFFILINRHFLVFKLCESFPVKFAKCNMPLKATIRLKLGVTSFAKQIHISQN